MSTSALKQVGEKDYYSNVEELVKPQNEDSSSSVSTPIDLTNNLCNAPNKLKYNPVFVFPERTTKKTEEVFNCLQKWEGFVLSITGNTFLARLYDISNKGFEEEAEIPLEEISDDDKELLEEGAVFYWSLGYLKKKNGQKIRQSIIKFRRLPTWHTSEIQSAQKNASRIRGQLEFE